MKRPIKVLGKEFSTTKAGVYAYLDAQKVFTGAVVPSSVAQFNQETGNKLSHGTYGARLDEYCFIHGIDRNKMKGRSVEPATERAPVERLIPKIKLPKAKTRRVGNLIISKDTKKDPEFESFLNEKSPMIQAFFMDLRKEYTRHCGKHPRDVKVINAQTANGSHETIVVRGVERYVLNNKRTKV